MEKLIIKDGIAYVQVGKHQIFQDEHNDGAFVLEKFEYEENGVDMFSVVDGYKTLMEAVIEAKRLTK